MASETRIIDSFHQIHFKDFGKLILSQGDHESLTIEADETFLADITSDVREGTLFLGFKEDWFKRFGKMISAILSNEESEVTYYLTCRDLEKISISGKCLLSCDALETDSLKIAVAGYGNLSFAHLDCSSLELSISGRGELTAAGRADRQVVRISGSGEIQTPELITQSTQIAISGQGNATLHVEETLSVAISGIGHVNFHGDPELKQAISGIGHVKKLNTEYNFVRINREVT
jgi:hypothetical protein